MECKYCKSEYSDKTRRSYCSSDCQKKAKKEYQKNRKYNYDQVKEWRLIIKQKSVEYKGGCCQVCGYKKSLRALDFHHIDPKEKDFAISKFKNKKLESLKKELDKCVLVCKNCHCEIHDGLIEIVL